MMNAPVILCGLGRIGWPLLDYLRVAGLPVVVIDTRCKPDDPRLAGARLIQGDCRQRDNLEKAGLAQARGILIVTNDDLVNVSTVLMVRHMHPDIRIVVRMFNQNVMPRLGKAVVNVFALSISGLTAPLLALTALTGEALGSFGQDADLRQIAELKIDTASPLRNSTVAEAAERHRFLPLAHLSRNGVDRLLLDLDGQTRLTPGDRLVICGTPRDLTPLLKSGDDDGLPHLLWAGWLRRNARVLARTFAEVDLPVKVCTAVLMAVVLVSTMVYYLGIDKSLPDGLYRTISIIATGADMREDELKSGWQKVFVSLLRIFGAAVTAAFTAIVTNYLIRARLGKALEIRHIPDSGHLVVCGLGNVGYRVVEALRGRDERVVVIESNPDARFLATVRRQGIAVIIGDATMPEVLRQANAATSRAVLAVTNNELANLEIALLARELQPQTRIVLRMSDPHLAQTLRDAADIRLALSTSALAAPAFVAALFGDRVQNIFLVGGKVLAAVELVVQADDPLLHGQSVRALSLDYKLLPVSMVPAQPTSQLDVMARRLTTGDRLTTIATLPDLTRLLKRERVPAEWAVEVTAFPLPARGWVAQLLRSQHGLSAEAAETALERLPVGLGKGLTRGQAEDLRALCQRERVTTEVRRG
ncbi:MAG: NAD-binding protein [Gemmataceae bacterium]|nr:NAD-binding protein [Gemmataceae bacterium]